MRKLVPTPEDLAEAGSKTGNLKPCPFCGQPHPLTFTTFNADTRIFRVEVSCSDWRCMATIGSNSRETTEARDAAVAKWNRRSDKEAP